MNQTPLSSMTPRRVVKVVARRPSAFAGALRLVVAVGLVVGLGGGALHGWETWVQGTPGGVAALVMFFLAWNWPWLLLAAGLCAVVDTKGTTITARVLDGDASTVTLDKDGVVYTVPVEKLSAVSKKLVAEILMARRGQ